MARNMVAMAMRNQDCIQVIQTQACLLAPPPEATYPKARINEDSGLPSGKVDTVTSTAASKH